MTLASSAEAHYTRVQYSLPPSSPDDLEEHELKCLPASKKIEDLTRPTGLVGEIIDWCEITSERPSRAAALGAALGLVAALAGREFASASDLRTNLYITLLAESGFGKDHPRKAVRRLAAAAGLDRFLGPGRVMSSTALRNSVLKKPTQLMMIDEFHTTIKLISDKKSVMSHLLAGDFLEFFTNAGESFAGAEYAATPAVPIHNPNLCVYGTTTPSSFWASVTSESVSNGFLPRTILINIESAKPPYREPKASLRDIPASLIASCQSLVKGNIPWDGSLPRIAKVVEHDPAAGATFNQLRSFIEGLEATANATERPFLQRTVEHAIKLALTVAVGATASGAGAEHPIITEEIAQWGCDLAWCSTATLIAESRDRVTDNQREADYNKILRLIKDAGANGLTPGIIPDRTRSIDERRRTEILKDLQLSGRIVLKEAPTQRGPRPRYFFIR